MTSQRLKEWEDIAKSMLDTENSVAVLGFALVMRQGVKELTRALREIMKEEIGK